MRKLTSAAATLLALCVACSIGHGSQPRITTLTVYAAASLAESFTAIGVDFEKAHAGVVVRFSFAGSPILAEQITNGAPADVFAPASTTTMQTVTDAGLTAGAPRIFARNRLELAVATGRPGIRTLSDALSNKVKLAVCAPTVPCGAAAVTLLAAAHLAARPATQEHDVKSVLAKVALGDADCGIVYVTDIKAAHGAVRGVPLPDIAAAVATYPVAALRGSKHADLAEQLVLAITGAQGQAVLRRAGFLPPVG